jgi:hypothetical protein
VPQLISCVAALAGICTDENVRVSPASMRYPHVPRKLIRLDLQSSCNTSIRRYTLENERFRASVRAFLMPRADWE